MLLQKTNKAVLIALALALTACSTTTNRSAIKPVPHALTVKPTRPEPPKDGSPEALLNHAVAFGAYVKTLENQLDGWILWATERKP